MQRNVINMHTYKHVAVDARFEVFCVYTKQLYISVY